MLVMILAQFCSAQVDTLTICDPGDPIQLSSTQGLYAYSWLPTHNLDNPSISNPTATPIENVTYIVEQLTAAASSENLILNSSFESGNEFFTSEYVYVDKINWAGSYGVNESAFNLSPVYFTDCPDHTSGNGQMLVVDGSPVPRQEVWCQNVLVQPNTTYAFSAWLTSVKKENPAALQFYINDEPLGGIFRAGDQVCQWRQFYETWNSDTTDLAKICIINQNESPQGNDFAMDDFGMYELATVTYDTTVVLIESIEEAKNRRIFLPTIFSPNNDGVNDLFFLTAGKGVARLEDFRIYNRWGNNIFEKSSCIPNDIDCTWDGQYKGVKAEVGVYSYTVRVNYYDKQVETLKGEVTLIR